MKIKNVFLKTLKLFLLFLILLIQLYAGETITFWTHFEGKQREVLYSIVNKYEKESGNKVNLKYVTFYSLQGRFYNMTQQDQGPDVINCPSDWIGSFLVNNLIEELTPYISKEDEKKYVRAAIENSKYKGRIYGIPSDYRLLAMFYNKKIITDPPKTTNDMIKLGKELKKRDLYVLAYTKEFCYQHAIWIGGFGREYIEDNGMPMFDSKEHINALKFAKSLKDIVPDDLNTDEVIEFFKNGKAAMIIAGTWDYEDIEKTKIDYGMSLIPMVSETGEWGRPLVGAELFVISAKSKHKKTAVEFIKYMTSPENQLIFAIKAGILPSKNEVYEYKSLKENRIYPFIMGMYKQAEKGMPLPVDPEMQVAIWGGYGKIDYEVWVAKRDIATVAKEVQIEAVQKIEEWKRNGMKME